MFGKEDYDQFVVSFCQNGNYLPAWRAYANDGAGFSIGFRPEYKYFKCYSNRTKQSNEPIIKFENIYYIDSDNAEKLTECINRLIQETEKYLRNHLPEEKITEIGPYLVVQVWAMLTKIKHIGYKPELESRICMIGSKDLCRAMAVEKFSRSTNGRNITYTKLNFKESDVSTIWVGPRCDFAREKDRIRKILDENGYKNIEIKPSGIPYRSTG